jgi:hypothetical protein
MSNSQFCGNLPRLQGSLPACSIPTTEEQCNRIPGCASIGLEDYVESWNYVRRSPLDGHLCDPNQPTLPVGVCMKDTDLAPLRTALTTEHPLRQNLHNLYMQKCGSHESIRKRLSQFPDFSK